MDPRGEAPPHSVQAQAAAAEHAKADSDLEAVRAKIRDLLAAAPFPVDGMAYDPDEKQITINGIPLAGASQAERIRIAAAVAMAGEPAIRVLFAREGSLLDDEGKAELARIADEKVWQLWLECVDSEREGTGIWIEGGEAFESEDSSIPAPPEDS